MTQMEFIIPENINLTDAETLVVEEAKIKYVSGTRHRCAVSSLIATVGDFPIEVSKDLLGRLKISYAGGGYIYSNGYWGAIIKPVKRRVYPDYYKLDTVGDIATLPMHKVLSLSNMHSDSSKYTMSPYSDLIPLLYLKYNDNAMELATNCDVKSTHLRRFTGDDKEPEAKKLRETALVKMLRYTIIDKKNALSTLMGDIDTWMLFDQSISIDYIRMTSPRICNSDIEEVFLSKSGYYSSNYGSCNIKARSYSGIISLLTMIMRMDDDLYPLVLAVVKPEDFLYQKYHIIRYGSVDLNRVTILVDRELDSVDFPKPALRKLYKSTIEPILKTLKCKIWKVPMSFIKDNCFLPPFKLLSSSSRAMRKEREQIVDSLYSYLALDETKKALIGKDSDTITIPTYPNGTTTDTWIASGPGLIDTLRDTGNTYTYSYNSTSGTSTVTSF